MGRLLRTALAGATGVAIAVTLFAVPAQAATEWELLGSGEIFLVSPSAPDGICTTAGRRSTDPEGSRISTMLFPRGNDCTNGGGTQCKSTVPIGPDVGRLRFDANTCSWVVQ